MSTLVIDDPSLVVLVGAAGSGKSTLARRWFAADSIVSSDALRAAISGNEAYQRASRLVFGILHRQISTRLAGRRLVVADATNSRAEYRRPLLAMARDTGVPAVAIVLDLPIVTILDQNGRRERVVAPGVVRRQHDAVRASADPGRLRAEGFRDAIVLRSRSDVDALRIELGPGDPADPPLSPPG